MPEEQKTNTPREKASNFAMGQYFSDYSSFEDFEKFYLDLDDTKSINTDWPESLTIWQPFEDYCVEDIMEFVSDCADSLEPVFKQSQELIDGIKELHKAIERGDGEQIAHLSINLKKLAEQ
jgi:hypothetical protein